MFFRFPDEVHRLIYTINIIERSHCQLRKVTKTKGAFPSDEALLTQLDLAGQDISRRWVRLQNQLR